MGGSLYAEVDAASGVATLWIENPERRNALSVGMWRSLAEVITQIESDPAVRIVAIRGAAGVFSAGADISEFGTERSGDATATYDRLTETAALAIARCRLPVVALVEGYCFGGGMTVAVACDLRFGVEGCSMSIPAARLGTLYPHAALERLRGLVGVGVVKHMLFAAPRFDTATALRVGLLERVFPSGEAAWRAIAEMARLAPLTQQGAKLQLGGGLEEVEREDLAARVFASADYAEGVLAFGEGRKPSFRGR